MGVVTCGAASSLRRTTWVLAIFWSATASAQAGGYAPPPAGSAPPVTASTAPSTGAAPGVTAEPVSSVPTEIPAETEPHPTPVAAPEPMTGSWDWVRMNSGEWLRGEITSFRDDVFLFDSEKFGDLTIDWADVVEVYSPNPNRYVHNFDQTIVGTAHIVADDVAIQTAEGEVNMPRSELTAILPGRERELSKWSARLVLSFNGLWGASNQTALGATAWVLREDARTRLRLDYVAAYGHADGVINVNNMWGNARFDYFLSKIFFVTPVFGQVGYNTFLNLDLRAFVGSGLGVKLIDRPKFDWDVSAGVVYLFTRYVSVLPPASSTANDAAVILGTTMNVKLTGDLELHLMHQSMLVATDFNLTQFDTQAILSLKLWDHLDLDLTFRHTRIRHPQPKQDGVVPDQDQFQLLVGLGAGF